jgi:predicted dehydrogenase
VPEPLRVAFLGCGFITRVHSRQLRSLRESVVCGYASRDRHRSETFCREFGGVGTYASYTAAIEDPKVDAVVVAVPPRFHLDLTLEALAAGKHVLVEKPAFLTLADTTTSHWPSRCGSSWPIPRSAISCSACSRRSHGG